MTVFINAVLHSAVHGCVWHVTWPWLGSLSSRPPVRTLCLVLPINRPTAHAFAAAAADGKCYVVQCIVDGKENPHKIAPSPCDFVTPPEEDRATAIGNMQKNGKYRACGSGDMLAERQIHTQTCSLQYLANAPGLKPTYVTNPNTPLPP